MKRSTLLTILFLTGAIVAILVALFMEAAAGPTFRPEDHPDLRSCIRAIPVEWQPGSIQREGAEQACMYVHGRR